jgi:hypothetical protein
MIFSGHRNMLSCGLKKMGRWLFVPHVALTPSLPAAAGAFKDKETIQALLESRGVVSLETFDLSSNRQRRHELVKAPQSLRWLQVTDQAVHDLCCQNGSTRWLKLATSC